MKHDRAIEMSTGECASVLARNCKRSSVVSGDRNGFGNSFGISRPAAPPEFMLGDRLTEVGSFRCDRQDRSTRGKDPVEFARTEAAGDSLVHRDHVQISGRQAGRQLAARLIGEKANVLASISCALVPAVAREPRRPQPAVAAHCSASAADLVASTSVSSRCVSPMLPLCITTKLSPSPSR